jgi:hypothetical protein
MKTSLISKYFKLSELLNYDTYSVSSFISIYCDKEVDEVFKDLRNLNLEHFKKDKLIFSYEKAIDECLKVDESKYKEIHSSVTFKSEKLYIYYLISLLELNSIDFLEYKPKHEKSKYETGSLF